MCFAILTKYKDCLPQEHEGYVTVKIQFVSHSKYVASASRKPSRKPAGEKICVYCHNYTTSLINR